MDKNVMKIFICAIILVLSLWCINPVLGDESNLTGYYEVRANVENASVFLDGVPVGTIQGGNLLVQAPTSNKPVNRNLMIQAPGYQIYNETILQAPKPGKNIVLRGTLIKIPVTPTGTVYLAVSPPGAEVMIDGIQRGVVGPSGILVLRDVKAGNRYLSIHQEGYQDITELSHIEANMENNVRLTMTPLTTGSVRVTSDPAQASVTLNGAPAGITPVTVPNVTAGQIDVRLSLPGYQDWTGTTDLQAGKTSEVSATLIPIPTSTPEPVNTTEEQTTIPTESPTPEPTTTPLSPIIGGMAILVICLFWKKKE
jgi:hypothetical protein